MGNQRRAFRLDVKIGFEAKLVSEERLQQGIARLRLQPNWDAALPSTLAGIDEALQTLLEELARTAPKAAGAIALLNQKVDLLRVGQGWQERLRQLPIHQVNLSASGLAFEYQQEIELGHAMHCTLTLPELAWTMEIYARVVSVRVRSQGGYSIGLDYEYIRDEDKEQLIRFNLLLQQRQLAEA